MGPILLLDTNLIILLVVGLADENAVLTHKRTRAYSIDDFKLLFGIVQSYDGRVATIPNTLSEVSNLLSFEADDLSRRIITTFHRFIAGIQEHYSPSLTAANRSEFNWLGLTDSALLETGTTDRHLLTADAGLHIAALKAGYTSTNFTHLTDAARI